ncbi:TetR/AcrR family transcriptional regulator [Paraglaciecola aquimarina]|uniref:TetR/AcrR family transcriptional regulator n=1 Tax=Paraglaciecola algarum TaxID=3050085 RepID=A0ABS9DAE3_9ALTE|nr:TetR/AcrR family transcriptional regulator [Paraglaciecola sp. G1-23]MCF2948983.1 TetR/AcrR family transcriptional regulator [Paraglaciecola sp. G1-23]
MKDNEVSIGAQNRNKILNAAEKEFALNGFKGARVQSVADRAGLPKTNVLYYFKSKEVLYVAVLDEILRIWNGQFDSATAEDDPAAVLAQYITDKMEISRTRPYASKIFALEIINNAPNLDEFYTGQIEWMNGRVAVIQSWIEAGKISVKDPYCLLFNIWATSQHYADFSAQITVLKGKKFDKAAYKNATKELISLILNGCGLTVPNEYR